MSRAKVTVSRQLSQDEVYTVEASIDPKVDVYEQLEPLFKAADKRQGYKNRCVLNYQEYVKRLPGEARIAIELAISFLCGEASLEQLKQINENYAADEVEEGK